MPHCKKILFILLFATLSIAASANSIGYNEFSNKVLAERNDNVMTIDIFINSNSKIQMVDVPTVGRLEIYSILGVKVDSKILNSSITTYSIELPKGIYIFKAGNVAQKIVAR